MDRNLFARVALAAALAAVSSAPSAQQPPAAVSPPRTGAPSSPPPAGSTPPGAAGPTGPTGSSSPKGSNGPKGAATAQPSPAAQELARIMVSERSWSSMIDGYSEALSTQISRALQARGEKPPEDLEKRVRSQLSGALDHKEGLQLEATELASRFSDGEIKAISNFYRSPAGQKLMKELPDMSASVDARIRERLTTAVPKIVQDVAPSLAESLSPGGGAAGGAHPGGGEGTGQPKGAAPPAQGRTPPKSK